MLLKIKKAHQLNGEPFLFYSERYNKFLFRFKLGVNRSLFLAGPVEAYFSHHHSKFPSEEFLASRKFSLSETTYYEANPARSNFLDAA